MRAESRGPRRSAARRTAFSCARDNASGAPGLGTRARLTARRSTGPCSYSNVTAAKA